MQVARPLGTIQIPDTGGWYNWQTVSQTVFIDEGTFDFGISATVGGWNIDFWSIQAVDPSFENNGLKSAKKALKNKQDLFIYPNPARQLLHISGMITGTSYAIYTITGRQVRSGQALTDRKISTINIQSLTSGMYFLKVTGAKSDAISFLKI